MLLTFLCLLAMFLLAFAIPLFAINAFYGQYQWARKRKGGLWLNKSGFWIQDTLNMDAFQIEGLKEYGWEFEDFRPQPVKLSVVRESSS